MPTFDDLWNVYVKDVNEYVSYKQRCSRYFLTFIAGLIENLNWSQYLVSVSKDGQRFDDFNQAWQSSSSLEDYLKPVSRGVWSTWIAFELAKDRVDGYRLDPVQLAIPLFLSIADNTFHVLVKSDSLGEKTYDFNESDLKQSRKLADYISEAILHKLQSGVAWDLREDKVSQPIKLWNPE